MRKRGIVISTIQLTIISIIIKLSGIIKQSVLASYCGANDDTDMFFVSSGILVSLCSVIFSALSVSLLTMHSKKLQFEGRNSANVLINDVLKVFIPISVGITLLFYFFSVPISSFLAPNYTGNQILRFSKFIRILSVSFVIWCYYLTLNVVLETDKIFIPGRFQGLFQNVFLIIAAVFFFSWAGIDGLVYAFLLSGLFECVLVTFCARKKFSFILGKIANQKEIHYLLKLSAPLIIGSAIYEINDIVDKKISTDLGSGNASILTYGSTINEIVTGVIVMSVSIVLFSHFASWVNEGNIEKMQKVLMDSIEMLTIFIIPIMIICIIDGDKIIRLLYGRGEFQEEEILCTYGVVIGYSVGFIFQASRAIIVKAFYAFQDTKTPMVNGALAVAINILLSLTLSRYIGVMGIALATSIAMFVVTVLLLSGLKKHLNRISYRASAKEISRGLIGGLIITIVLLLFRSFFVVNVYLYLSVEVVLAFVLYIFVLYVLKSRILSLMINYIRKRK